MTDPFADIILPDATLRELRAIVEDWQHPSPPTRVLLIDPPDGTTEAMLAAVKAAAPTALHFTHVLSVREVMAEAVAAGEKTVAGVVYRLSDHAGSRARTGLGLVRIDASCPIGGDSHPAEVLTRYAVDRVLGGDAAFIVATAQSDIGWRDCFDVVVYAGAWEKGELTTKVAGALIALLPADNKCDARRIAERCGGVPDLRRARAHIARSVRLGQRVTTESLAWAMGVPMGDGL